MKKITILIANKYFLVNYAIKCILSRIKGFEVCGVPEEEVITKIAILKPDIFIIEVDTQRINGLLLLTQVKEKYPRLKSIVLLDVINKETLADLLRMNLDGYILKNVSREELISAATSVYKGEKYYSKEIQQLMHESVVEGRGNGSSDEIDQLSKREHEIFEMIIGGMTSRQIAGNLFLSKHTVITHRRNIMKKLNVNSTSQLILTAVKRSAIPQRD
jgi:DNA-binding NarL/FixJ family response regulator